MSFYRSMVRLMPYCLDGNSKEGFMLLNRDYKPIGFNTRAWVNYEGCPIRLKFRGLSPSVAAKLAWDGKPLSDAIFLYADCCAPYRKKAYMDTYLERLRLLMSLEYDFEAATNRDWLNKSRADGDVIDLADKAIEEAKEKAARGGL